MAPNKGLTVLDGQKYLSMNMSLSHEGPTLVTLYLILKTLPEVLKLFDWLVYWVCSLGLEFLVVRFHRAECFLIFLLYLAWAVSTESLMILNMVFVWVL